MLGYRRGRQNRRKRHNYDDNRVTPAGIDLQLDRQGFDAIDGGQNAGQHRRILGEAGREGNAVFAAPP